MDERLRFVAKLLEGETMTAACREFGISRKTGYKIFNRYKESGFESLSDRSRRPVRYANQLPPQLETMIVNFWTFEDGWPVRLAEYHDVGRIQSFSASLAALTACGAPNSDPTSGEP